MQYSESFERAMDVILPVEGGFVDHPEDPGGMTNRGITFKTYMKFLGHEPTRSEMQLMPVYHAKAIYWENYWKKAGCDQLPEGVDLFVCDVAVNSGPRTAVKMLQRAVGARVDGVLGPRTVDKTFAKNPLETIKAMQKLREAFYRKLKTFKTFGRGWLKRNDHVGAAAATLAGTK